MCWNPLSRRSTERLASTGASAAMPSSRRTAGPSPAAASKRRQVDAVAQGHELALGVGPVRLVVAVGLVGDADDGGRQRAEREVAQAVAPPGARPAPGLGHRVQRRQRRQPGGPGRHRPEAVGELELGVHDVGAADGAGSAPAAGAPSGRAAARPGRSRPGCRGGRSPRPPGCRCARASRRPPGRSPPTAGAAGSGAAAARRRPSRASRSGRRRAARAYPARAARRRGRTTRRATATRGGPSSGGLSRGRR